MCRSGGNHHPDAGASRAQFLLPRIPTRPGVWCCNGFCSDDRTSGVPGWTPAGLKRGAAVGEEYLASLTWLAAGGDPSGASKVSTRFGVRNPQRTWSSQTHAV